MVVAEGKFEITTRAYLGPVHLLAAWFFAHQAEDLQKTDAKSRKLDINFYGTAAVNSSVAFLEATINELLADCHDDYGGGIARKISKANKRALRTLWEIFEKGNIRVSVLNKYKLALYILERKFDPGANSWVQAKALIDLRNYLTHFVPQDEVVEPFVEPIDEVKVEKTLKGKFQFHPGYPERGQAAFCRFLSAGCAIWSAESCLAFADAFFVALGIQCPYESVRAALHPFK